MHENGEKLVFVFRLHISFSSHSLLSDVCAKAVFLGLVEAAILPVSLTYETKKSCGLWSSYFIELVVIKISVKNFVTEGKGILFLIFLQYQ